MVVQCNLRGEDHLFNYQAYTDQSDAIFVYNHRAHTCQNVLQHTRERILSPGTSPGDVPPVEVCPHKQEKQPLQLLFRHYLTQVDCGSGSICYPSKDLIGTTAAFISGYLDIHALKESQMYTLQTNSNRSA